MDRRSFLRAAVVATGGAVTVPLVGSAVGAQPGSSPYGSLDGIEPDENGIILPPGFTSRIVAMAGEPVGDSDYRWRVYPDGAAVFDDGAGGWYHTVNSEVFRPGFAGVSAIHYGPEGEILDAYQLLEGSNSNCGGGPTPWGTFLSGEEDFTGYGLLWECDPTGATPSVSHPAMGIFTHEAAAVDPVRQQVYMTEDQFDGRFYRFTPTNYPDLSEGLLEFALVADDGTVNWIEVPDPSATETLTRQQLPEESTAFLGGEGIWYHNDVVFWSTKFDNVIHAINTAEQTYSRIYEADPAMVSEGTAVLSGVDNLTVDAGTGDVYVAEDGGNMEIVIISPEGEVAPFLRITDQDSSEITGPVFNPRRDRLYFSSQRGPALNNAEDVLPESEITGKSTGITYEVTGPFRGIVPDEPDPTPTAAPTMAATPAPTAAPTAVATPVPTAAPTAAATPAPTAAPTQAASAAATPSPTETISAAASTGGSGSGGGGNTGIFVGVGAAVAAAVAAALVALRRRRTTEEPAP